VNQFGYGKKSKRRMIKRIVISILISILILGCESPTKPIEEHFISVNREMRCALRIVPDLYRLPSGEYFYYVPFGHFESDTLQINYFAPSQSEVQWTVHWPVDGFSQSLVTYTDVDCEGEVNILILPNFINWIGIIEASVRDQSETIVVLIIRSAINSSY